MLKRAVANANARTHKSAPQRPPFSGRSGKAHVQKSEKSGQKPEKSAQESADRAHTRSQKDPTLSERCRWWLANPTVSPPFPPAPRDKVAEKDLPQAKRQAIEAMHEFGVLVEASRASGMGRWQLEFLVRKETSDLEFRADMQKAKRECQERLEGAFIARGMYRGGDLAGIFYLKHNRKRYREVQRVELTGKDGVPLNALDAARAELLERLGKLTGSGSAGSEGSEGAKGLGVGGVETSEGVVVRQLRPGDGQTVKRAVPRKRTSGD